MAQGFGNTKQVLDGIGDNILAGSGLSNTFATRPTGKFMTGARVVLRVNGQLAAFVNSIDWEIKTDGVEVRTIDDYLPHEIAPTRISISGSMTGFRIPGQAPTSELWQGDAISFLFQKYVTIEVRDSQTNQLLFFTPQAQITGRVENYRSEALAGLTLRWKAVAWKDEKEPQLPKGVRTSSTAVGSQESTSPVQRIISKAKKFLGSNF